MHAIVPLKLKCESAAIGAIGYYRLSDSKIYNNRLEKYDMWVRVIIFTIFIYYFLLVSRSRHLTMGWVYLP